MIYSLPSSLSNTPIPMLAFDDGKEHIEFEFFKDRIEVFYLDRDTNDTYETEFKFGDRLKKIVVDENKKT